MKFKIFRGYVVYAHYDPQNALVYIGHGRLQRAFVWHRPYKHRPAHPDVGWTIQILCCLATKDEAIRVEEQLILRLRPSLQTHTNRWNRLQSKGA